MKISIQSPTQPSDDLCIVWDEGTDRVCSIDEGVLQTEVLTPKQAVKFVEGYACFDVNKGKLREHCKNWFQIGR